MAPKVVRKLHAARPVSRAGRSRIGPVLIARRVFFSFHFERDLTRANMARNRWLALAKGGVEPTGFFTAAAWHEAKKKGKGGVTKLVDDALKNTTVTAVLVGEETASQPYVKHAIERSIAQGNGIVGVRIHELPTFDGSTDEPGANPLPSKYKLHEWGASSKKLADWIEEAAKAAGK